jgi:putative ABC transport system permease protein
VSAVRMRARADLKSRPASVVVLTVLFGLAGAVAMTALAGARRTDSAYARYREAAKEPEAFVPSCNAGFPFAKTDLPALGRLPEVASWGTVVAVLADVYDTHGVLQFWKGKPALDAQIYSPLNDASAPDATPPLLEGRTPEAPNEVVVGWGETEGPRPGVGDVVVARMLDRKAVLAAGPPTSSTFPDRLFLPEVRLKVVGVVLAPGELDGNGNSLWTTTGFAHAYRDRAISCDMGLYQLRHGLGDTAAFGSGVQKTDPNAFILDMSDEAAFVERSTHLPAIVMRLFGWLVVVAFLMVFGQALVRRTLLGSTDDPILRALGMTRGQVVRTSILPGAIIGVGGAVIALVAAVAASALLPFGVARRAEPDPGIALDPLVLVLGTLGIVLVALVCVAVPAWSMSGARGGALGAVEFAGSGRRSRLASWLVRLGLPPTAVAGSRLALEAGHGRTATPVRSAVVALALAVGAMTGALGFAASMDHLAATPRLWGVNFDIGSGHPFLGDTFQRKAIPAFRDEPGLEAVSAGNFQLTITATGPGGSAQVWVWGLESLKGPLVHPTMLEGRWPEGLDEIALGRQSLADLGIGIGDTVHGKLGGVEADLTVVGVPVFPDFGFGPGLGKGAGMTMDGLRAFYPGSSDATLNLALARYAPGVDRSEVVARLNRTLDPLDAGVSAGDPLPISNALQNTQRARRLPLLLSVFFAAAAFATLVHVLVTSIRRRRRDLAILQTLGFRRRQILATVIWQATVIAGLGVAFGVPLGALLGRFAWALFADRLGVVSAPVVAWPAALLAVPVTIGVAALVALGPGLVARRTKPAVVLRAE